MWVKNIADFWRFCYLNIPCLRVNIPLTSISSSSEEFTHKQENSKTDVSVSFRRPYLCPWKGHKHGASIQSFINLGKTFFRLSLSYELFHRPDSWQGFLYIYLLSFPRFQTFCIKRFPFLFLLSHVSENRDQSWLCSETIFFFFQSGSSIKLRLNLRASLKKIPIGAKILASRLEYPN